jgi:hypothetical protein
MVYALLIKKGKELYTPNAGDLVERIDAMIDEGMKPKDIIAAVSIMLVTSGGAK